MSQQVSVPDIWSRPNQFAHRSLLFFCDEWKCGTSTTFSVELYKRVHFTGAAGSRIFLISLDWKHAIGWIIGLRWYTWCLLLITIGWCNDKLCVGWSTSIQAFWPLEQLTRSQCMQTAGIVRQEAQTMPKQHRTKRSSFIWAIKNYKHLVVMTEA